MLELLKGFAREIGKQSILGLASSAKLEASLCRTAVGAAGHF